jgi:hypothetical protein
LVVQATLYFRHFVFRRRRQTEQLEQQAKQDSGQDSGQKPHGPSLWCAVDPADAESAAIAERLQTYLLR